MKEEKQKFTLGFIFDSKLERVLLLKKNRGPKGLDKMKGLLNSLGGHVEENEKPLDCIIREVKEESGLEIKDWTNFCNLDAKFGYIYCFYAIVPNFVEFKEWPGRYKNFYYSECIYKQMEDEEIGDYWIQQDYTKDRLGDYRSLPHMSNLDWLIPQAINHYKNLDSCELFEIKEVYGKE